MILYLRRAEDAPSMPCGPKESWALPTSTPAAAHPSTTAQSFPLQLSPSNKVNFCENKPDPEFASLRVSRMSPALAGGAGLYKGSSWWRGQVKVSGGLR